MTTTMHAWTCSLLLLASVPPALTPPPISPAEPIEESQQVGNVELTLTVTPGPAVPAGTELTYSMRYVNRGFGTIANPIIQDQIPPFTEYKVGSASIGSPPITVVTVIPQFSNDGGTSWTYVPVSGGGGAPPSFDANVTHVRFLLLGTLQSGVVPPAGVAFTVRIR